jgi:hypothetical protein
LPPGFRSFKAVSVGAASQDEDEMQGRLVNRLAIYIFGAMVMLSIGEGLGYLITPP